MAEDSEIFSEIVEWEEVSGDLEQTGETIAAKPYQFEPEGETENPEILYMLMLFARWHPDFSALTFLSP